MASAGDVIRAPVAATRARPGRRTRLKRIGLGYSRFVAVMKLTLPLIAAVMIAALAVWPQFYDAPQRFQLGATAFFGIGGGGHRLTNARFTGTDRNLNPYTLTAEALVQPNPGVDEVTLRRPEADFTTANGDWVVVAAPRGRFSRKEQRILLNGGVSLFHDSGYELRTENASVDFQRSIATSQTRVHGQGPAASLRAQGFRIDHDGKRILFTGPARVVLYDDPAEVRR